MNEEQLIGYIEELERSAERSDLQIERERLINYYDGDLSDKITDEEGKSKVTSRDVMEVVEFLTPEIMDVVYSTTMPVYFRPVGPDDDDAAKQDTAVVSNVFFSQNDSFRILLDLIKDGLWQYSGHAKISMDESDHTEKESYHGLTDEQLKSLLSEDGIELEEQDTFENFIEIPTDQGMIQAPIILHDVTVNRTSKEKKVVVDTVAPENFEISGDASHINDDGAKYVADVMHDLTPFDLLGFGVTEKKLREIIIHHKSDWHKVKLTVKDAYIRVPSDDMKSMNELERVLYISKMRDRDIVDTERDELGLQQSYVETHDTPTSGPFILIREPADIRPYASWSAVPLPHRAVGNCPAGIVKDLAVIKTALERGVLNNIYLTNNPEKEIVVPWLYPDGGQDDIMVSGVGRNKRVTRPGAINPITVPFMAKDAFTVIDYFDNVRKQRTGVSEETLGMNVEQLRNVNTGVMSNAMALSSRHVGLLARNFAENCLKNIWIKIHDTMRLYQDVEMTLKIAGQWVDVDPSNWRRRTNVAATIGIGNSPKEQKLAQLFNVSDKQAQVVQGGGLGTIVTPKNIYNTLAQMSELSGLDADDHWTDPGDEPLPQTDEQQEILKQAIEMQAQIESAKLQLDREKEQLDHQRKVFELQQQRAKLEMDKDRILLEEERKRAESLGRQELAQAQVELKDEQLEVDRELQRRKLELESRALDIKEREIESRTTSQGT